MPTNPTSGTRSVTLTTGQVSSGNSFGVRPSDPNAVNQPPTITCQAAGAAMVGQVFAFQFTAVDPDHDPLTWDLPVHPDGMEIDPITGLLLWTPTNAQVGTADVLVRVSDGHDHADLQSFTLKVFPASQSPVFLSNAPTVGLAGHPYYYAPVVADPLGEGLLFSLDQAPAGMTIDSAHGTVQRTTSTDPTNGAVTHV